MAYVDSVLQKIYDRLLAKGLIDESTLLFITGTNVWSLGLFTQAGAGDHGESFGAHGHFQHGSCVFSECIRVASMMTSPLSSHDTLKSNNRSGFASTEPLGGLRRLVDFFPTALDWIGAETTGGSPLLEGKSLLSSDGHEYSRKQFSVTDSLAVAFSATGCSTPRCLQYGAAASMLFSIRFSAPKVSSGLSSVLTSVSSLRLGS